MVVRPTTLRRCALASTALVVLFWTLPVHARQSEPAATAEGARVSMNHVWSSLPDFVCKEKIVSSTLVKGKTKEQRVMESVFMAQRKTETRADGSNLYSIVESRELTAIDGKAAGKNAKTPSAPLLFDGLAANILFIADVPRYHTASPEPLEGRLVIRIGFITGSSREFIKLEFPAAVSDVQIDTQSSRTLHVESRFGFLHGGKGTPVLADFQSIDIDGKAYWVPRLVKAEATNEKNETATYVAEYTDCRKFEVTVQIRPASDAP